MEKEDVSWWSEHISSCSNMLAPWQMNSLPNLPMCEIRTRHSSRLTEEQSARTFLRFGPPSFFLFIFTTGDARTTDKTNEKRILKGSWDSHQLPALTQPQMYMCGCHFGIWCTYPDFNPFFLQSHGGNISPPSYLKREVTAPLFLHDTPSLCNEQ